MLLGHADEGEVAGRLGRGEETDEGLVLEEDEGAPGLEVVEELGGGDAALDGRKSVVGGGRQEVSREVGVLVEDEDYLVRVEPTVPQVGVDCAQRGPKIYKSRLFFLPTKI